jgi:4-amino-4-deoxy-L-arabinose transferase-like glycosyltransferase
MFIGLLAYAAISASWYLAIYIREGSAFLRYALGYHSFGRFFGSVENQTGPWYYYFIVLAAGFFPWTGFIPSAIESALDKNDRLQGYLFLSWITVAFIFFSLANTKLPDYINVIYPAMAILTAAAVVRAGSSRKKIFLLISSLLSVIILVLITVASAYYLRSGLPVQYMQSAQVFTSLGVILLAGIIFSMYFIIIKRYNLVPAVLAIMMVFFISNTVAKVLPEVEKYRPVKQLSLELGKAAGPNNSIGIYNMQRTASIAYYSGRHIEWLNSEKGLSSFLKSRGERHYLLISKDDEEHLKLPGKFFTIDEKNGICAIVYKGRP